MLKDTKQRHLNFFPRCDSAIAISSHARSSLACDGEAGVPHSADEHVPGDDTVGGDAAHGRVFSVWPPNVFEHPVDVQEPVIKVVIADSHAILAYSDERR